jgi:hypothetical protein
VELLNTLFFEGYYISDAEVDLAVTNLELIGDLP